MKNKDIYNLTIEEATKIVRDLARFKGKNKVPYALNVALRMIILEELETLVNDDNNNIAISQLRELKEAIKEAATIFREEYPEETKELTDEDVFFYITSNSPKEYREAAKEANGVMFYMKKVIDKSKELKEKERELEEREAKLAEKIGSYRKPKHLVNLSTNVRPLTIEKASLFSSLDETIAKAKTPPMMGLDLTRGERKLVNCFSMLLHKRSQTIDSENPNYYSGDTNTPARERYMTNDIIAPRPELRLTLYELSKAYSRKDNPSGRDMQIVKNLLETLLHKTYYLEIEPIEYKDRNNQKQKVSWRGRVALFMLGDTDNGELLIQLNSIFALQIRDFYVNYPMNYDQLLEEANAKLFKNRKITSGMYILIEYLASRRGANHSYRHEIYKSNLYEKINYKWAKRSNLKDLNENLERGINIAKEIGLLEKYEETTGSTGEIKCIFYTRKDWIKR